jgi:Polyketide cyclase / dehydrase and lipid transport
MRPVRVITTVPYPPDRVYDFLDVMANHERFTNHMLTDWEYSGPERGVGAKARVRATLGPRSERVEIEVISGERPTTIVEQNVGARGRRVATGTYTLEPTPTGETLIAFEYAWNRAPLSERVAAPLVRAILSSANQRALARLAEQLQVTLGPSHAGSVS